ncbi:beta-glucosidase [Mucilaginibacter daejeonensis]|uniref:GH1 family beta-glucosidase n=1 Tax=Mucilaginibacter daejeonensis TaxID=398049 RepID=UPI001D17D2CB|nr:GH1 family beta-glucosidase [Mucilaginibacter daejeonensis]UEG55117.1 beta-glucosidase [Mucilaginibacter daejeonensis]
MDDQRIGSDLHKDLFGPGFDWGVSTAAFQTEGSWDIDGKDESIWDTFTQKKGKIFGGQHARVACDFYNRYEQDIDLIGQLNIPNFRFSIAWTRVIKNGAGEPNEAGLAYYDHVINYCLEKGITPWVTLYHWDLPQVLEAQGGWTNRHSVQWFSNFVTVCAKRYGDRVKNWMVMNEPAVFTGAGYFLGLHAPGRKGLGNFVPAVHHVTMSIAAGSKILRALVSGANIGNTFSCSHIEPYTDKPRDVAAAKRADVLINRLYIEPLIGMGYPYADLPVLKHIQRYIKPGDEDLLTADLDFIGLQNYTREIVRSSFFTPYVGAKLVEAKSRKVPLTEMGWEVYPQAMYEVIKKFSAYPQIKNIRITENGAAFKDVLENGRVNDEKRTRYLHDNLQQVLKAKNEGCPVNGYFVWTLTDNFEWAEGYRPHFGLIHVNFDTQERIIKDSGHWYKEFLAGN